MKTLRFIVALLCVVIICYGQRPLESQAAEPPNIVVIFADDLGYNDLGCFGSETIQTPNLDRLAREGRRLTSFMVASSVCSPSRAALLTGCYPKRVGMHRHVLFPATKHGLHPDEYTIADHLKSAGYATACIGKWHLGHYPETLPRAQGFDSYYGIPYSNDMNHPRNQRQGVLRRDESWKNMDKAVSLWKTPLVENESIIELPVNQRTITRRYTDRAIEFVEANQDRPFFLYLPHTMPHVPLFVPKDAYDPDPQNAYTCTIEHIDAEVGRLMDRIRQLDLARNTIVVFTSDNGPWLPFENHGGSADPLRNGKGTPFEGGQRVPCIVWAPGRVPANSQSDALISTMDLLPTIADWTGHSLPSDLPIDGLNVAETITGDAPSPRDEFVYYKARGDATGLRQGDWKLLINPLRRNRQQQADNKADVIMLFRLDQDLPESENLAEKHPKKVTELRQRMEQLDARITREARPVWRADGPHPWPDTL